MQQTQPPSSLDGVLRTARIIVIALCMGVLIATVVLALVRDPNRPPPSPLPMVTYVGIAFAVLGVAAALIVPSVTDAATRKAVASGWETTPMLADPLVAWAMRYQTRLIVRSALLEGPAFLQAIAYFLEGQPVSLILAGILFLLLVLQFPTRDRVTAWIERQRDLMEQERQAAMG